MDTNILAYAEGVEKSAQDLWKARLSQRLLARGSLGEHRLQIPCQAFAELAHVLSRKSALSRREIAGRIDRLCRLTNQVVTDKAVLEAALELSTVHQFTIFDSIIMAAAASIYCDLLISEDLQDGFTWRGLVVTNPFGTRPDPRLADLIR